MYKLDLEKVEPESKLPTCSGIEKRREFQKKICFIDYAEAFDCVDHKYSVEYSEEMGIPDHFICLLETCMQDEKQHLELYMEQWPGSKLGKQMSRLYIVTLLT